MLCTAVKPAKQLDECIALITLHQACSQLKGYADLLKCIELIVNNQSLTTFYSHFPLSESNQMVTKAAHWWSWSCDLHK